MSQHSTKLPNFYTWQIQVFLQNAQQFIYFLVLSQTLLGCLKPRTILIGYKTLFG